MLFIVGISVLKCPGFDFESVMKICFLVGSMAISGGTYVIVQHAAYLAEQGHEVVLAVQEPFTSETLSWHDKISKLNCVMIETVRGAEFDVVVATWWKTALEITCVNARRYIYFVQSIESLFYPVSEGPLRRLVDATYSFPVEYVTEASWIKQWLSCDGKFVDLVRNGIRKDVYSIDGPAVCPRVRNQPRVLIEGHFGVSFKNTALALRLAKKAGARDIWLLTGSPVKWMPGVSRVFSRVPMTETGAIYRSCDILVKLSTVEGMFGPPLEMFHCGGTAVVFDVNGFDEYIKDGENALVVRHRSIPGVIAAIKDLLLDHAKRKRLIDGAIETASQWPDWEHSSKNFSLFVLKPPQNQAYGVGKEAIQKLIDKAWADYGRDENQRLADNPSILRLRKLEGMVRSLPAGFQAFVKRAYALFEATVGARQVK